MFGNVGSKGFLCGKVEGVGVEGGIEGVEFEDCVGRMGVAGSEIRVCR